MPTQKEVESLCSKAQRHKAPKWDRMFISRRLIMSGAFLGLRGAACKVMLIFLTKCVPAKPETKSRSKRDWIIRNNGQIQFTYREARRYGFSRRTFRDS